MERKKQHPTKRSCVSLQETNPRKTPRTTESCARAQLSNDRLAPFPPGSNSSRDPSPPQLSPVHTYWFGSISRTKGSGAMTENPSQATKEDEREGLAVADPTPSTSPSVQDPSPIPQQTLNTEQSSDPEDNSSRPQPTPSQTHAIRWFSSSRAPTLPSPLHPSHPPETSLFGEAENPPEVQKLPDITPPSTTSLTVVPNGDTSDRVSLSSLNPSTSRFSLTIPLLGRPRILFDQDVAAAQVGNDRTPDDTVKPDSTVAPKGMPEGEAEQVADNGVTTNTVGNPTPSACDELSTQSSETSNQRSSSLFWWSYISSSSRIGVPEPSSLGTSQAELPGVETSKLPSEEPPLPTSEEPRIDTQLNADDARNAISPEADLTPEGKTQTSGDKAASVRSADISRAHGSAWYSPWSWYGSSSTASLPIGLEGSSGTNGTKTEAEMVKEEALARGVETTQDDSLDPMTQPTVAPDPLNPIQSSISANKLGWSSFFSSKTLITKSVTSREHQTDENGAEVMYLDEEDQNPVGPPPVTSVAQAVSQVPVKDLGAEVAERLRRNRPPSLPPRVPRKPNAKPESLTPAEPSPANPEAMKDEAAKAGSRKASPASSKKSGANTPSSALPNLVLPSWEDTFYTPPRSLVPQQSPSTLSRAIKFVSGVLFAEEQMKSKLQAKERDFGPWKGLPKAWDIIGDKEQSDILRGCRNVVVIGIHGWFPGTVVRTVFGQPTGTSTKFVNMMVQALEEFQEIHKVKFQKITKMPLEGEGIIEQRVDKHYRSMLANQEWMDDLRDADAILVATHSQGSIVSTHLLDHLIRDGHIRTSRNSETSATNDPASGSGPSATRPQRICCLAFCGIHLGPLAYLRTSPVVLPYIQYFESTAAREIFEFQNTESGVSKAYVTALRNVVNHGTKMVYVASLNDQVVPVCSALFTAASHPLMLRALYIDGDAYQSTDFLSNLLVLLLRVLNSGLSDSGLVAHLSEATAGSLNGVGHSTAYEESAAYSLAVKYLFLTNDGPEEHSELKLEPFNATIKQNDYEIPWSLRDLVADERVTRFFAAEIMELRDAFQEWHPKTTILRDVKRKLQPIRRLPAALTSSNPASKL